MTCQVASLEYYCLVAAYLNKSDIRDMNRLVPRVLADLMGRLSLSRAIWRDDKGVQARH